MIRVAMQTPITTVHGDPLVYTNGHGQAAQWTLGRICREALVMEREQESANTDMKLRCWQLAVRITDEEISLTPEEYVLLKERIGRLPTMLCGPALTLLNNHG